MVNIRNYTLSWFISDPYNVWTNFIFPFAFSFRKSFRNFLTKLLKTSNNFKNLDDDLLEREMQRQREEKAGGYYDSDCNLFPFKPFLSLKVYF